MTLITDMSDLIKAIQKQTTAIENLSSLIQTDLEEIKQLLALTQTYPMRYYFSQENFGGQMQGVVYGKNTNLLKKKAKPRPPFVPAGQAVACVRCGHEWKPQSRTPQKCPTCRSPWWYPPRWRWQKNEDAGKEP